MINSALSNLKFDKGVVIKWVSQSINLIRNDDFFFVFLVDMKWVRESRNHFISTTSQFSHRNFDPWIGEKSDFDVI